MKTYKIGGATVVASDDLQRWDCNCVLYSQGKYVAVATGGIVSPCVHILGVQRTVFGIKADAGATRIGDSKLRPDPKPDVQRAAPGARKLRD